MTPDVYLTALREVLDDYELDVASARIRMQDRLRALLGTQIVRPIQQPADAEREASRTAPATTPMPAEPQESAPDDALPSVELSGGPDPLAGAPAPPAATSDDQASPWGVLPKDGECPRCRRRFGDLNAHVATCSGDPTRDQRQSAPHDTETFTCEICQRSFGRQQALSLHRSLKHPGRIEQPGQAPTTLAARARVVGGRPAPTSNPRSAAPLDLPARVDIAVGE